MKPSLPYQGIARRALQISNKIFDDDMVIITSDNVTEEKELILSSLVRGQNLSFIAGSTYLHKYHVVNRKQNPCPACAHGIPFVKRK